MIKITEGADSIGGGKRRGMELRVCDASEPDVPGGTVRRVLTSFCDAVVVTPRPVTEIGPAAHTLRLSRIRPGRVHRVTLLVLVRCEPVRTPLPRGASDVENSVLVGLVRVDGYSSNVSVNTCVFIRELTLPDITSVFTVVR